MGNILDWETDCGASVYVGRELESMWDCGSMSGAIPSLRVTGACEPQAGFLYKEASGCNIADDVLELVCGNTAWLKDRQGCFGWNLGLL